jgi:hypothetical protein
VVGVNVMRPVVPGERDRDRRQHGGWQAGCVVERYFLQRKNTFDGFSPARPQRISH